MPDAPPVTIATLPSTWPLVPIITIGMVLVSWRAACVACELVQLLQRAVAPPTPLRAAGNVLRFPRLREGEK